MLTRSVVTTTCLVLGLVSVNSVVTMAVVSIYPVVSFPLVRELMLVRGTAIKVVNITSRIARIMVTSVGMTLRPDGMMKNRTDGVSMEFLRNTSRFNLTSIMMLRVVIRTIAIE